MNISVYLVLRRLVLAAIISTTAVFGVMPFAWAGCSAGERKSLGGPPLCEASATVIVRCPQSAGACLLVGDNEETRRLFLFRIVEDGDRIRLEGRSQVSLASLPPAGPQKEFRISDIEAITRLLTGELIIFGSHSRNKRCKAKKNRQIYVHGILTPTRLRTASPRPVMSEKAKCKGLFGATMDAVMKRVCRAIKHQSRRAKHAKGRPTREAREKACKKVTAFNLEGAVAVPAPDGSARVWIGLRAPLIDGMAVMLRQKKSRKLFKFDAVAFVDLQGHGIRELTFAQGKVWGIGGPATDETACHTLWSIDPKLLQHGTKLTPTIVGELPASAEGLAIWQQNAIVLMDGDKPTNGNPKQCAVKSDYLVRKIVKSPDDVSIGTQF